jgi:hypothetical protein
MNLHYKISPGIDLSDNQAMEIRCLKASQAMRQASVVCGGSDGIQRWAGDLKEVNDKQFPDNTSSKAYFPDDSEMIDNGDGDKRWVMSMSNENDDEQ